MESLFKNMPDQQPADELDQGLARYRNHLQAGTTGSRELIDGDQRLNECLMTPLFSFRVRRNDSEEYSTSTKDSERQLFSQYGLLGEAIENKTQREEDLESSIIMLNTNTPCSAFICGSQGSGKSYTLSRLLENCLLPDDRFSTLKTALAGIVFNLNLQDERICEATYLRTAGIKVRVLVSPSNADAMKERYTTALNNNKNLNVVPFKVRSSRLNNERMMRLMAFGDNSDNPPFYMQVIQKVLRKMALQSSGAKAFDYAKFQKCLKNEDFDKAQQRGVDQRMDLLDSFVDSKNTDQTDPIVGTPGTLTIVDLSDTFIHPDTACLLFDVALSVFPEITEGSKVVAVDEAHKYMEDGVGSNIFTRSLLQMIREQRHLAVRTIIATQESTISPKLLE